MAEPDFLAYIGAIGGVIGAATGIAGAAIAYVSYKKTEQLKVLDLRIELGRSVVGLIEEADELPKLLERAQKSRVAVSTATGMRNSGSLERWNKQLLADQASTESLHQRVEDLNANHQIATTKELEEALIATHALKASAARIRQTYEESIEIDNRQRDALRQGRERPPPVN